MNLYSLLEKGFPKDKKACALETHDGLYYSWGDLEAATAKLANLLASLKLRILTSATSLAKYQAWHREDWCRNTLGGLAK